MLITINLRSGSILVSLCNNIASGKAKRKPSLVVAVRDPRTAKTGPDLRLNYYICKNLFRLTWDNAGSSGRFLL